MITKTRTEIEVQPIEHQLATRDVAIKRYSMNDGGEVCCDSETLECHNWRESECVRLAGRYAERDWIKVNAAKIVLSIKGFNELLCF